MRIVQLSTEFAPIAKAGGLGEVIVGLSRELTKLGQTVEIIIPKYKFIDPLQIERIKKDTDFECTEKNISHKNSMWISEVEDCKLLLLETFHPADYFNRDHIYGYPDDVLRFLYFAKAALEYLKKQNKPIDVLHLHDWPVAIAAVLAKDIFQIPIKSILLTIHNAAYQGLCAVHDLDAIGLNGAKYLVQEKLQDDNPKYPLTINLLKGGIVYADAVNTVSPSYAKEMLKEASFQHALHITLNQHKDKVSGILNGIDQKLWNPMEDPHLAKQYSFKDSIASILVAKQEAKKKLQKQFHLADEKLPWIGSITRIVYQKNPKLLEQGLRYAIQKGCNFLLLGSSPDPSIQKHFDLLKQEFEKNTQSLIHFAYNEALAHEIYAALDFLLIPSVYEPCGLSQLIAMRYGTIPIVRSTGGLKDTVFDNQDHLTPLQERNGFTFQNSDTSEMENSLERAIDFYRQETASYQSMVRRIMKLNFSWQKPAQEYLRLYQKIAN